MRQLCLAFIALALTTAPAVVRASSGGINGFSGEFGIDCNVCHTGGQAPAVVIDGPTLVFPGTVNSYTLTITPNGLTQRMGGLDVSADGGSLIVTDPGTYLLADEVTHDDPRVLDGNNQIVFTFDWMSPLTDGTQRPPIKHSV